MREVTLPGTGLTTSVLGYGCNALLGPRTRQEGRRLLETAFDAGIRHFDVARAYGFGDAEGLVGEFAEAHRGQVTITTKFGILPDRRVAKLRWAVALARKAMRYSPLARSIIRRRGMPHPVQGGSFDLETARQSLDASLRALRTDRIDLYLLHDPHPEPCSPELLELLRERVQDGTLGTFGVGTTPDAVRVILRDHPEFANVTQFKSNALERQEDLLLAYAVRANPGGIVLFASTRPEAIRSNARVIAERTYPDDQLDAFDRLTADLFSRAPTSA
jgi:D-threo-aldose 1-dehydrogenase